MKSTFLTMFIASLFLICSCDSETGSVFNDHPGVPYNDGSDIINVMDGQNFFFGNLHSHTKYSDGKGSPAEAFTWARDNAGYDFYAVTDHAWLVNSSEWEDTGNQADIYNQNGSFVAIRGFEWSATTGHICVWGTANYTNAVLKAGLSAFADWLDDNNGLAEFNHPGREADMFNDFSYDVSVTDNVIGIETGNKDVGNINGEFLAYYPEALAKGWRLAPTTNQDNHSLTTNSHRTVILATALTRSNLYDAMRARRIYSSDDPNMEVVYKIGAHWMGEVVNIVAGSYEFIINVNDDEPIRRIEVVNQNSTVVAETDLPASTLSTEWRPIVQIDNDSYYYVKVYETDSNNDEVAYTEQVAVTAPIWLNVQ